MGDKKKRKQLFGLVLGLCLACSQTAYADITIIPMPLDGNGLAQPPQNADMLPGSASGASGPGTSVPGVSSPGTSVPGVSSPGTSAPGASNPGTSTPGASNPGTSTPGASNPGTSAPGVSNPGAGAPGVSSPGTGASGAGSPGNGVSGQMPGSGTAQQPSDAQGNVAEPAVTSEGVVLMDGATGKVLYGKNQDTRFYPASITKVMTALIVLERCNLNDVVTFSASATTNLESGAVSLKIAEGDQLTVEQALYGLLLKSANEIGNGLAEHVGGSVSGFAELMNAKAADLGCKNTHFTNPHGLNDSEHKTTPYDMALIMRAALQNDTFRRIDTSLTYEFPATKNSGARTITMGHKMMYPSDSRYYQGIIGGKTGYTSLAGNTLVTGAERDGVRLIAVVMKSKGTQYADTKALLDYGFANYAALTGGDGGQGTSSAPEGPSVNVLSGGNPDTAGTGWRQDNGHWYFIKNDGNRAAGEWVTVNGLDYWFDADGTMATEWRRFTNGSWYYFKPSSGYAVKSQWVQDGGAWYYLGADGVLLTNTTTPDGYQVDANGVWIQ